MPRHLHLGIINLAEFGNGDALVLPAACDATSGPCAPSGSCAFNRALNRRAQEIGYVTPGMETDIETRGDNPAANARRATVPECSWPFQITSPPTTS